MFLVKNVLFELTNCNWNFFCGNGRNRWTENPIVHSEISLIIISRAWTSRRAHTMYCAVCELVYMLFTNMLNRLVCSMYFNVITISICDLFLSQSVGINHTSHHTRPPAELEIVLRQNKLFSFCWHRVFRILHKTDDLYVFVDSTFM